MRVTLGRFAFAASVRVVAGILHNTPGLRTDAKPARTAGFADTDIFVINIADNADCGTAHNRDVPDFAGREAQLCEATLFRHQLDRGSRTPGYLATFSQAELDIMDKCAHRNIAERHGITHSDF